jgi:beta-glucosidase
MEKYERDHLEILRPYLPECMVLLKKNGAFPLDKPCRIAAYGSGVRYTVKGGTGSGEVNSRYFVTVEEGLKEAGFDVVSDAWAEAYATVLEEAKRKFHADIKARAKAEKINMIAASMGAVMKAPEYRIDMDMDCDAAVYVVSRISGEGNDRLAEKGDYMLTDSEVRDIRLLNDGYEKFMLVINAGGPVDLSPVMDCGNILVLSQLGVETGSALADVLLGRAYPSGKLATTWAPYADYCKAGDFGLRDDCEYREGIYVGYRYFDSFGVKPLFPFGYGLGYTDFTADKAKIKVAGPRVGVYARIVNTGSFKGKETLQVYVSCPSGRLDRETKSLAAFTKTKELRPGESEIVHAVFDIRDLAGFDTASASYVLEAGDYIVLTGTSSDDVRPSAILRLEEEHVERRSKRLFAGAGFEDIKSDARNIDTGRMKPVIMDLSGCITQCADEESEDRPEITTAIANMTASDLAMLNTGSFKAGLIQNTIGDAATSVAGAAGESTSLFRDAGISGIIMSDGPAGVRIAREYYEDRKGRHAVGSAIPESIMEMLPGAVRTVIRAVTGPKRGTEIKNQYCTAIPIGTAIAQSWNTDFAEICGDIVGREMDIFGIDLWLAPALNIHRNVLCGRNFEYFSEDPLISGLFAAALTRGVQAHPGRGVTIKHYAANNQETNRYASNSVISERALREIYLRGFGICISEGDPVSVMTSYNLINGIHTSESRALTEVLRSEFEFDGLVMTDWVAGGDILLMKGSKYGTPDPALVAAAGCSLFMPGSKGDYKRIMAGLKEGRVTVNQLRENAGYLIRVLERLGKKHG